MIYLDNAATSWPKPESVFDALDEFARKWAGNPGRSGHRFAVAAEERVQACRDGIAKLLNAGSSERVVLTLNATDALNIALKGFLRPGDHVVTSHMEHNSINRPLAAMAKKGMIAVDKASSDPDGHIPVGAIEKLLRSNTRLIAITHCSNVLGVVNPVDAYAQLAHGRGVALLLDSSQAVGVESIDVRALGVDMVAFPGHKNLFGPMGTGALYVREGLDLDVWREGGTGIRAEEELQPGEMPYRLEGGTPNTHGYAGLAAGVAFVLSEGVEKIRVHERELALGFVAGIEGIPGVEIYSARTPERQLGPISINIRGMAPDAVGRAMNDRHEIACRPGLHCAPGTHAFLGTLPAGTVRFSFGYFNKASDVEAAVAAVRAVASKA